MKIVAHFLPNLFEFLIGVVSPGVKKYALLLRAVEKPLSFVFWMIVNQATFPALIRPPRGTDWSGNKEPTWVGTMRSVLLALLVCTVIILGERVLVQLISISYHRKQFDTKIKESKRNIYLLGVLYEASRELFPAYCNEFAEEDYVIQDTILDLGLDSRKRAAKRGHSGTRTPLRLIQEVGRDAGRVGDKITSVFGAIASEVTGKKVFDVNSAHSVVITALEKQRSSEALAKRIWMSFVVEGKNELYEEDLAEVMGPDRQEEAAECFASIDRDGNGDISLEEMIFCVSDYARQRKSIATSMHDVDQAINALDGLLLTITLIICLFVFSKSLDTLCFWSSLTKCSCFPCPRVPHHPRHVGYCPLVSLVHLRRNRSRSPRFLHLSVCKASLRHWRSCRHHFRAASRGTHCSALHCLQACY